MAVTDHGFFSLNKADRISPLFDLNLKEFKCDVNRMFCCQVENTDLFVLVLLRCLLPPQILTKTGSQITDVKAM
jgi:hypothetical protein